MSRTSIPEDMQEEILLRLPVKSILRFKSVCTNWDALLSSGKFIKDHLNLATKNHLKNRKFLIRVGELESWEANDIFYSIDYASVLSPTSCKCDGAVMMNYPNNNNAMRESIPHWIVGSCNGLILLLSLYTDVLFLWNPSTKEYKKITEAPLNNVETHLSYGFGYDSKTDNYKVVCIATGNFDNAGWFDDFSEVHVYKAGSWCRGQDIPYACTGVAPGVLLNGALHWLGEAAHPSGDNATREEIIISFDMNSEKFMDLPLPEEIMTRPKEGAYALQLQVLGDSLCLICRVPKVRVDVWVMQNYGARESWTKQFTTTQERIANADLDSLKFYRSLKNGEILIENGERLGLYDQKNDIVRFLNINDIDVGDFSLASYVESLVSVNSGTYMGEMEEKEWKDASEILVSHLKNNSEVQMEAAAEKELKRKHNELAESSSSSSSKRKRTSDEFLELLDAINYAL